MGANFMLQDLVGTVAAICLFPLFSLIPGYVLGWLADVLSFRRRTLVTQMLLGVVISIAVSPILTYLAARVGSFTLVWAFYAATWLALLILAFNRFKTGQANASSTRPHARSLWGLPLALLFIWVFMAVLLLVDLQLGDRLYYNMVAHDYTKRIAMVAAATRSGIPPADNNLYPGYPLPMYYYYFWPLFCSLVARLGGSLLGPRAATLGGTVWCGIALMAIVALYLRFFRPRGAENIRARAATGIGLLLVGGADIVPVLMRYLITWQGGSPSMYPSVELWNEPVGNWLHSVLWVPHHMAGLVACLTSFLLVQAAVQAADWRRRFGAAILAGLAFASAVGISIWVAFVFALLALAWTGFCLFRRQYCQFGLLLFVGALAALAILPFLLELNVSHPSGQADYLSLTVRRFYLAETAVRNLGGKESWVYYLVDLLLLPLNYGIEFAFFALIALVYWKAQRRSGIRVGQDDQALLFMLAASLIISTFIRSQAGYNDLAWRAPSVGLFVLLLWAVEPTMSLLRGQASEVAASKAGPSRRTGWLIATLKVSLLLGVLSCIYEGAILRTFPLLSDQGVILPNSDVSSDQRTGERTLAVRQAYQWINTHVPRSAIVQHNPAVWVDLYSGLYGEHQAIVSDSCYGHLCLWPEDLLLPVQKEVAQIFALDADLATVNRVCEHFSIRVVLVKDTDPVWRSQSSWLENAKPLFENGYAKVFACGGTAR